MSKKLYYALSVVVALTLLVAAFAGGFLYGHVAGSNRAIPIIDTPPSLSLIQEVRTIIKRTYVGKVNDGKLNKAAISGMLESLNDKYSDYIDPKHYKAFQEYTAGEFSGVGVTLGERRKVITVVEPMPGTPAARAGIRPGDVIVAIDDSPTAGMTLSQASAKIRGPKGTSVKLKVRRSGVSKLLAFKLVRDRIALPNVSSKLLAPGLGYIRIHSFSGTTGAEVAKAAKKLASKDAKGVVVDLRDNAGGLVDASVEVASVFMPSGKIVEMRGRGKDVKTLSATDVGYSTDMKVVVLVNGGTASASEILAGAIQDRKRGLVVGTHTFGKASVQTVESLSNGGALKMTSAHYYTPNGRSIDKVGIKPTVVVKSPAGFWAVGKKDVQKNKAIEVLRRLIAGKVKP